MAGLCRLLTTRVGSGVSAAAVVQGVLTAVGVFTFVAGALYLPTLGPTRVEGMVFLLLLAVFTLLCTAVGQLAVVVERLDARDRRPVGNPDRQDNSRPAAE